RSSALFCLVVAVGVAVGTEPAVPAKNTSFAADRPPAPRDPPAPPEGPPKEGAPQPTPEAETEALHPRNPHAVSFLLSPGNKHLAAVGWGARPALLTLADLTCWRAKRDYDFDGGLNFNIR